jgi:glycerophosphoryl diester phosphodiesterase
MHNIGEGVIENSASAFERAIAGGFGVECDLQLSRDEQPMVVHDETLDRVTGRPGVVREMMGDDIAAVPLAGSKAGDRILRFAELLALIDGRVPLAVELKPQRDNKNRRLAEIAMAATRDYKGPLAFISFDPSLLVAMKAVGYRGPLGVIVERFTSEAALKHLSGRQRFVMRHLLHYPQTRFNFIACDQHALDLPAVRFLHMIGFPVLTWTIASRQEAAAALKQADQIAFEAFDPEARD